jgi:hypothetical protein
VIAAWLGFALAALFFYPLAAALADNPFYLQWQHRDLTETIAALALLSVIAATGVYVTWPRQTRGGSAALGAIALVPIASFVSGVLEQMPFDTTLIRAWDHAALRYGLPAALALAVGIVFVRWPLVFARGLRRLLLVVSLVAFVVARALIVSHWYREAPVTVGLDASAAAGGSGSCASVVALLFDELSFPYVFDGDAVRPEFPNIARLAAHATTHLRVTAPAHETLISMPGYLALRPFHDVRATSAGLIEVGDDGRARPFSARGPDGLFATARRLGFRTEMAGYYLPYCDLLDGLVDACRSLSFYNVPRADPGFSLLHPIETTLILWPRQFPFGLAKNPPFARLQRELVARTLEFAVRPLPTSTFRFVHFSVPHLPFVFDADGYDPPFDPLRTDPDTYYARQIGYVDRLLGTVTAAMQRDGSYDRTTLVLLSDHGFRFGGRDADPTHIPFIVKTVGQTTAREERAPQQAIDLLRAALGSDCR